MGDDHMSLESNRQSMKMDCVDSNQSDEKEIEQSANALSITPSMASPSMPAEDDYFDPFAIEDNKKKYGMKTSENVDDQEQPSSSNTRSDGNHHADGQCIEHSDKDSDEHHENNGNASDHQMESTQSAQIQSVVLDRE